MAIKDGISLIIDYLFNVSDAYRSYQEDKKVILDTYRDFALSEKLSEAEVRAKKDVQTAVHGIEKAIDSLIMATYNGNTYDASSDAVANAAQLLSVSGVSAQAVESVLNEFIGNQVALSLIHASAATDYLDMIEKWMFDSIGTLESLKKVAGSLLYNSIENYPRAISQIRDGICSYALHQGVDLDGLKERIEALKIQNVINLMGLDPSILK